MNPTLTAFKPSNQSMSSMRLIIAAAVLAGLVAAADRVCDASSEHNDLFTAPATTCAAWANCTTIACTAAGANTTASLSCLVNTTKTCDEYYAIADAYLECLVDAAMADSCQASGAGFGELGMALAGVMTEAEYRGSDVQLSCSYTACKILNWTNKGTSCATAFGAVNDSELCAFWGNDTNTTPAPSRANTSAPAPTPASGAASVSVAVMAVLATLALLL